MVDSSPFRYIVIVPMGAHRLPAEIVMNDKLIDEVLTAVEYLEPRGWEFVGLTQGFVACMRRRPPPGHR